VDEAVRDLVLLRDRREDQQDPLEENRRPAHEENPLQPFGPRGRPARQSLEQITKRDQPADDEDRPRQIAPRLVEEEASQDEAGLDRDVAVTDEQILREEEVN